MATISNVNGKKITKIKYKGEIFDVGGSDFNPLQYIIDNHKGDGKPSGEELFIDYQGSDLTEVIKSCDFSKIISAKKMFDNCMKLISIPYLNTSSCTDMSYMFSACSSLTIIQQLETSNVTTMEHMFYYCDKLTTIPQLDTSKVTNMNYMFYNCRKLTTISLLDTSNVTNMSSMFAGCYELTTIPQLDTRSVTNMGAMFSYCYKLTTIDITHMNISSISGSDSFAYQCYSLTKLIIRNMPKIPVLSSYAFTNCYHFKGTVNADYNPQGLKDGRIYVPDDKVDALKTATNWSVYADIIVPLSTLVE